MLTASATNMATKLRAAVFAEAGASVVVGAAVVGAVEVSGSGAKGSSNPLSKYSSNSTFLLFNHSILLLDVSIPDLPAATADAPIISAFAVNQASTFKVVKKVSLVAYVCRSLTASHQKFTTSSKNYDKGKSENR